MIQILDAVYEHGVLRPVTPIATEIAEGQQVRVVIELTVSPQSATVESRQGAADAAPVSRPSALGKYAHVGGGSEAFARAKQAEIEREDRRRTEY